jgi:hypothetical protein
VKISRVLFAASLGLLASIAAAAVAPPPPPKPSAGGAADLARDAWRSMAIGICTTGIGEGEGVGPAQLERTCGCATDRFMAGRPTAALPTAGPALAHSELRGPLLSCAFEEGPVLAAAFARRLAETQPVTAPPPVVAPVDGKPVETQAPEPTQPPKRSGSSLRTWLDGLSLPSWLSDSGLPPWAWVLLALLVFLVLRGLKRGGDQRDLIGPPPSMRLGARANQPAPRRADPPQRS